MCDYSLESLASRPAKVGDKLVTTAFRRSVTRGFAAVRDPNVAVCLLPGTEIAFDRTPERDRLFGIIPIGKVKSTVARFRKINPHDPHAHHDALEFPDGKIVLLTKLREGQHATVLQLPVTEGDQRKSSNPLQQEEHAN